MPFSLGNSALPARAASAAAEAGDFHWHLARFDRGRDTRRGCAPRHWRWRVRCRAARVRSCMACMASLQETVTLGRAALPRLWLARIPVSGGFAGRADRLLHRGAIRVRAARC